MYLTLNQKTARKQQCRNNKTIKVDDRPVHKYTVQLIVCLLITEVKVRVQGSDSSQLATTMRSDRRGYAKLFS